jgi:hypothetical protein
MKVKRPERIDFLKENIKIWRTKERREKKDSKNKQQENERHNEVTN